MGELCYSSGFTSIMEWIPVIYSSTAKYVAITWSWAKKDEMQLLKMCIAKPKIPWLSGSSRGKAPKTQDPTPPIT